MRWHEAYYDNIESVWRVIAKDNDGYWFNVVPDAGDMENAMTVAHALNEHQERMARG